MTSLPSVLPSPLVLVVDDDVVLRLVAQAHLEDAAFQCVEAGDGHSGLEVFRSAQPDIVLVDVAMPGMDGFEVCTRLRELPEGEHVPIIMVTGNDDLDSVHHAYEVGATDFVVKPVNFPILIKRLHYILRNKELADELRNSEANLASASRIAKIGQWVYSVSEGRKPGRLHCSGNIPDMLGWRPEDERSLADLLHCCHLEDRPQLQDAVDNALQCNKSANLDCRFVDSQGAVKIVRLWIATQNDCDGNVSQLTGTMQDVTDRKQLEGQLLQAQKLESIGQLAAGISHEINTPVQYVSDNIRFLQEAFDSLLRGDEEYATLLQCARSGSVTPEHISRIEATLQETDRDYLIQEVPQAISQCLDGAGRISEIVSAMKEFSHPGSTEKESVDLNALIVNAVTISRNEWKFAAELSTQFQEDLPPVPLHRGEFGQVIINLIVNAAHAITSASDRSDDAKGTITIRTRQCQDAIEIRVTDTGCGMPESVVTKIFDPFFTTKEVGKGTGQGLAIAHSTVVDRHAGKISALSTVGKGTTITIVLPLEYGVMAEPSGARNAAFGN